MNVCGMFCFLQSSGANVGKKRMWKNLKQIVAHIRLQNYKPNEPTCEICVCVCVRVCVCVCVCVRVWGGTE